MTSKWDTRFLSLAEHISSWSKDPSTKVGAAIIGPYRDIISLGYNGFPRGVEDTPERLENRELKYKMIVHAERNAILFARRSLECTTLYTWPFAPCSACAGMIVQSRITRVVALLPSELVGERWGSDLSVAKDILREGSVLLDLIDRPQNGGDDA